MKIKLFFLLLCAPNILSIHQSMLKLLSQEDVYLSLLERTYVSGYEGGVTDDEDCGEPLILTPYIEQNRTAEARLAAYVDSTHFVPGIDSYAGYLTVDEEYNGNLFFWYFPVMGKPIGETPLILWLQGGPGASSLYGLFEEIGPYTITKDFEIKEKEHSWSKNHSLLFIDNPVGTGYSFTDSDDGYCTNQTTIGESLYKALQQFLQIFPELRKAPLIIAGESYAGKHIPSLGIQIHWNKEKDEHINLQGLAIGNGFIDPVTLQKLSYVAQELGILDDEGAEELKELEDDTVNDINENNLREAYQKFDELFTLETIRFLILVKCMASIIPDIMSSAKSWLEELLDHYRVMVYNGHLDTVVAYHPSVNTYNSLLFADAAKYKNAVRQVWILDDNVAGYYKKAGNFLEVMVRNAGHMVPLDKPEVALKLISAFALDLPLTIDPDEPPTLV